MSHRDPDIVAVRELLTLDAEPTDESVARTWRRITLRQQPAARPRFRLLIPVTAAAMVAGLAVAATVVFRPAAGPVESGASPSQVKTAEPNLAPPSAQAVAALNALARTAADTPASEVRPGQYIYVAHDGWAVTTSVQIEGGGESAVVAEQDRKLWFAPEGMVQVAAATEPHDVVGPERDATPGPASPQWPTPRWLASLPTDPAALLAELRAAMGPEDAWSTDHQVWTTLQQFYLTCDLLLRPKLRAALLRSFTQLRGLTTSEVTIDRRRLVAIRHTERGLGEEILFDPASGQAVGRRTVVLDERTVRVWATPAPRTVRESVEAGVTYQAIWTQKVVGAVGAER